MVARHCRVDSSGKNFINALTDVLWCIDGHEKTLASRACSIPKDLEVLPYQKSLNTGEEMLPIFPATF